MEFESVIFQQIPNKPTNMDSAIKTTPYDTYSSLLDESFQKISKTVPAKKYKELMELCKSAQDQVKKDQETKEQLSANKYFYIFKMALESKIPRLMEFILYRLQKLFTYEFLDGNCEDNCVYEEGSKPSPKNGRLPRLLIDAIVEAICECAQERDAQVQLQVIKALLTIVIAVNSKVHERTLLEAFKTQYSIHITSNSQMNKNTAKAALTQMINVVFSKMNAHMRHGGDSLNIGRLSTPMRPSKDQLEGSLVKRGEEAKDESSVKSGEGSQNLSRGRNSFISSNEDRADVTFPAIDQYVFSLTQNMVDFVALHDARVEEVKRLHDEEMLDNSSNVDEANDILEAKIAAIPLNPIPLRKDVQIPDVEVKNELDIEAGRFGWCIVCRGSANLFCKDTKHPVCNADCKKKHLVEVNSLDGPPSDSMPNYSKTDEASIAFIDAQFVFRAIVKLCIGDSIQQSNTAANPFAMRTNIIGLELILAVLEKPKQPFLNKKAFIDVIKNNLCDGLLRYSVSTEKTIFALVVSIFYCLFLHFRKHLKQVILVFIETIFLKLLDSGNSSFHHKHLILSFFDKVSKNTMMLLEIFVNYDCDMSQVDISERIVGSLSKIANGKFTKSEHQNIISTQDEYSLRQYATQILVQMLRSFNATIDAEIADSKITQKMRVAVESSRPSATSGSGSFELANDFEDTSRSKKTKQKHNIGDLNAQRNVKQEMGKAALKFNMKPKNGIAYLVKVGLVPPADDGFEKHVTEIVKFLKTTPSLDKTIIGEFLGVDQQLNKACLYEYIDQFDLTDKEFVLALKMILSGFRLPGEGQIVDRMMEKFGEKFVADNPEGSDSIQGPMSAECVYLLSYATMMMQTSLHNPNAIKSRMTVEDFAKMIKGINAGQNLNQEFVQKIYDTVEKEPFTLNEDEDARIKIEAASANTVKKKQDLFQKEGDSLVQRGKKQIQSGLNNAYQTVDNCQPIRPYFENIWSANLATFSVILEETNDDNIAPLCIEGFAHSIKICGYFNMVMERDAFVSSLAKFTQVGNERRIKPKNIEVIKSLLELATNQGNFLGESWLYILETISKLEELINLGAGQIGDKEFFGAASGSSSNRPRTMSSMTPEQQKQITSANAELIVQNVVTSQLDAIFQASLNLDQDAIIQFIECLCKVSVKELNDAANPRKFSLQCLVEVADLNMARIRFVWQKIWQMMSEHFVFVGRHPNLMVSIFAIDSLRQLADKFLIKEEFSSFNFQKDFLKPFEQIMLNNLHTRADIKEYVVMCITNICATKTTHIKSGWSVIINIFTLAAQDTEPSLVTQSFEALSIAVRKHFDLLEPDFIELVNCLNKYSCNSQFPLQSNQAHELLLICAEKLQEPRLAKFFVEKQGKYLHQRDLENMSQYPPQYGIIAAKKAKIAGESGQNEQGGPPDEHQIMLSVLKGLWFPILTNLTNLAMERDYNSQKRALDTLFRVLQNGISDPEFNQCFWKEIFSQILYPLMEDIHLAIETPSRQKNEEELRFYQQTFKVIVGRFNQFFLENFEHLQDVVPAYFDIVCLFISKTESSRITQVMIQCYTELIISIGEMLSDQNWDSYVESLILCFEDTMPIKLIDQTIQWDSQRDELEIVFTRCISQLFIVNHLKTTVESFYHYLSYKNIIKILRTLEVSSEFSSEFNAMFDHRMKLWSLGFMQDLTNLPGLIAQEFRSLATILYVHFNLYYNPKEDQPQPQDSQKLFDLCSQVLKQYVKKQSELTSIRAKQPDEQQEKISTQDESQNQEQLAKLHETELARQLSNLTPIVSNQILGNFQMLSDQKLKEHIKELGPILIELSLCNDYQIRLNNKELLSKVFNLVIAKF